MLDVTIREVQAEDAESLQSYAARLFAEELPGLHRRPTPTVEDERAFIAAYCDPPNAVMLLAEDEGQVVGLAGLLGRPTPGEAHVGALGISVDREYRARGLGTRLIDRLLELAPALGLRRIEVEAFANNPDAIRLYERIGFELEGVRKGAVVVDGEDVDVMLLVSHRRA
jgi:putative acetyltransferase